MKIVHELYRETIGEATNMATAHHLSMVTNSCIKPPVNPKSGLSSTIDERWRADASRTWQGKDADYFDEVGDLSQFQASRSVNFDTTNTMMETVVPDLNELSDAEFYHRLVDLKSEHMKTLQLCENLYNEKMREQRCMEKERQNGGRPLPVASVDVDYSVSTRPPIPRPTSSVDPMLRRSFSASMKMDKVKDMATTKPPSGKPKFTRSVSNQFVDRTRRQVQAGHQSDEHMMGLDFLSDTDCDMETRRKAVKHREQSARRDDHSPNALARTRIDNMWENFAIDDYMPRASMRERSNSFSGLPTEKEEKKTEWKHRITIPKPFNMTVREESKTPRKSKVIEELDKKREEQIRAEEEECQKKFKAKPVPAHVYMPLFDEIMEEKETRKRYIREKSQELLQSQQKPFKFSTREEEKKKYRRSQNAALDELKDNYDIRKSKEFKANPFPEHIFDDGVLEKLSEEEEYRRIRKQMRAEDLLRSSSLPPNMKARGKEFFDAKSRQKTKAERARKAGITVESKFKPKVNESVPDFDELHHKFMKEMSMRKYSKEATVCKPFNFRSVSQKHKIYDDIMDDESRLKENQWPFKTDSPKPFRKESGWAFGGALSSSMDSIPTKMTTAAALRKSANKDKLQKQIDRELAELEREKRRRMREKELKKAINTKAMANDQTRDLRKSTQEKLKEYRSSERARMEEYQKELNQMYKKVQSRPLLFEQTIQKNAQQRAERKYNKTLEQAGLNEDFVRTKGKQSQGYSEQSFYDSDDLGSQHSYPIDSQVSHHSQEQTSHLSGHSDSNSASRRYTDDFEDEDKKGNRTEDDEDSIEEDVHDVHDDHDDLDMDMA